MSYKLKNNSIVMIAVVFAAMMTFSQTGYAQVSDEPVVAEAPTPQPEISDGDLFGLDDMEEGAVPDEAPIAAPDSAVEPAEIDAAEAQTDAGIPAENAPVSPENSVVTDQLGPDAQPAALTADAQQALADVAAPAAQSDTADIIEEPKSPFESFGNAILSKVDNSLFNQMSDIEKQTTLLNLEYKREEVKNRIEALRIQRLKAQQEEAARLKAEEERLKEEETQRKIREAEAQEKLKQVEIELEKVRQARVLNEYMNEMLIVNQKWVEKNMALQKQVKELRDERIKLIKDFEDKMGSVQREANANLTKVQNAKAAHDRIVTALQTQVQSLKKSLAATENTVRQLKDGASANSANPFADMAANGIDANAIDMSDEYAIMDITGKGNDIVAKIVSKDGTTFIVHQGSMLKGGEVVMAITDNYVAFDKEGIKSYLYTGGTVREYEPEASFNGADKTPVKATAVVNKNSTVRNVRGSSNKSGSSSSASASAGAADAEGATSSVSGTKKSSSRSSSKMSTVGQGMFVK